MLGIIKTEDYIVIEFYPIFGSEKGVPKWASFKLNITSKSYGEYGIAWSNANNCYIPDVWITFKHTTYTSFRAFYKAYKYKTL